MPPATFTSIFEFRLEWTDRDALAFLSASHSSGSKLPRHGRLSRWRGLRPFVSVSLITRCGLGVVGTGGGADSALPGAAEQDAMFHGARYVRQVVFAVPAVAQQYVGHARGFQGGFGIEVFSGQAQGGCVGVQDAGVGQERETRGLGGIDHGAVLGGAVAQFIGGDQQQFIDAFERGGQCGRLVVVGGAYHHAPCGQVLDVAGVSDQGNARQKPIPSATPSPAIAAPVRGIAG